MIIDKGHVRWGVATGVLAAIACALYLKERSTPAGLVGGSVPGLIFGIGGSSLIVFAALLGMRRKFRALRLGRSATWLKGHIWLGALSLLLILFHGGFSLGGPLTSVLMVLLVAVVGSGFLGIALQQFMPRLMTEQLPLETIYEEIPHVCAQLREKADLLVGVVCGDLGLEPAYEGLPPSAMGMDRSKPGKPGVSSSSRAAAPGANLRARPSTLAQAAQRISNSRAVLEALTADPLPGSAPLRTFYLSRLRPYLDRKGGKDRELSRKDSAQNIFDYLRVELGQPFYDTLEQLADICEERRQLRAQERMHLVLHGWLLVHMPLTAALLVLGFVHAVWALRY